MRNSLYKIGLLKCMLTGEVNIQGTKAHHHTNHERLLHGNLTALLLGQALQRSQMAVAQGLEIQQSTSPFSG